MNADAKTAKPEENKKSNLKRILFALFALLLILLIALAYYLITQRPITRVLPGVPAQGPRYITSTYGDFGSLTDVAISRNGNRVYVVDSDKKKIWVLNSAGNVTGSFGRQVDPAFPLDGFIVPLFIAVGPKDEVYVTDRERAKISVYSPTGKFVKFFTPTATTETEWSPLAIAVDTNGDVYLCDAKKDENRILVFNKNGKLLRKFGKSGRAEGEFAFPNGIAVTKDRIYVSDSSNARIQMFDKKGKYLSNFLPTTGTEITHPTGIDATRNNEILVSESFGHEIQAFNNSGGQIYKFGTIGIGDGQFRYPSGIAVSAGGRVYIADKGNNRIQVWQY